MTGSGLGLKRKRMLKKAQSQSKRRKVNVIFTENKKIKEGQVMEDLKSGLEIFLKRSIQKSI